MRELVQLNKQYILFTLVDVAQWIELWSLVSFPVRAHAWVSGWASSRGRLTGNHALVFLSLSYSLPLSLSKNK